MATKLLKIKRGLNPKHEIRNSKHSYMTEFRMFQTREFRDFEIRKFEFVSDWSETDASPEIRISDFKTANPVWSRLHRPVLSAARFAGLLIAGEGKFPFFAHEIIDTIFNDHMRPFLHLAGKIRCLLNFFGREAYCFGLSKVVLKAGDTVRCCRCPQTYQNPCPLLHRPVPPFCFLQIRRKRPPKGYILLRYRTGHSPVSLMQCVREIYHFGQWNFSLIL
jgi:hypothetical protein